MIDRRFIRNYLSARAVKSGSRSSRSAVNTVIHLSKASLAVTACLFASLAAAQSNDSFPQIAVDAKTVRVQNKAEEVYSRTEYKRAFAIYRKELAPIGDKYGQYMVGFMYLTGKGVEEDRIAASAWYRLAAERGTKEFVQVRDQVLRSLDDEERTESDRQFIELRKQYGDLVLLTRAIREDHEQLKSFTGSRISGGGSPVVVLDMSGSTTPDYYRRIEQRLQARLDYIAQHTEVGILDHDVHSFDIDEVEEKVGTYLGRLD
jgi:hypothetical protein